MRTRSFPWAYALVADRVGRFNVGFQLDLLLPRGVFAALGVNSEGVLGDKVHSRGSIWNELCISDLFKILIMLFVYDSHARHLF